MELLLKHLFIFCVMLKQKSGCMEYVFTWLFDGTF